jgi:hypothetical protein
VLSLDGRIETMGRSGDASTGAGAAWSGYAELERLSSHRWLLRQPDRLGTVIQVELTFPPGYSEDECSVASQFVLHGLSRGLEVPVAPDLERLDQADLVREVIRLREALDHQSPSNQT